MAAAAVTDMAGAAIRALCGSCAGIRDEGDTLAHVSEVVPIVDAPAAPTGLTGLSGIGLTSIPADDTFAVTAAISRLPLSVPSLTNAWFVGGVCSRSRVERVLRCMVGVLLTAAQSGGSNVRAKDAHMTVYELCRLAAETCPWLSLQAASEFVAAMALGDLVTLSLDSSLEGAENSSRRRKIVLGIPGYSLLDTWERGQFHLLRVHLTKPELCVNLSDDEI